MKRNTLIDSEEREANGERGEEVEDEDGSNPNQWSDKEFQPWLFGHDVFDYVSPSAGILALREM